MKILPKVLRNLPNFWNKTHKNKPDWQQFVHFRKSQKVVNHSTLTLNSQVGMVWADCYNHQPTTIHLGRVLSVTNQSYESAAFSIPQPCGIQYRVTHIHTHCTLYRVNTKHFLCFFKYPKVLNNFVGMHEYGSIKFRLVKGFSKIRQFFDRRIENRTTLHGYVRYVGTVLCRALQLLITENLTPSLS